MTDAYLADAPNGLAQYNQASAYYEKWLWVYSY
jgi:hypothetical protein